MSAFRFAPFASTGSTNGVHPVRPSRAPGQTCPCGAPVTLDLKGAFCDREHRASLAPDGSLVWVPEAYQYQGAAAAHAPAAGAGPAPGAVQRIRHGAPAAAAAASRGSTPPPRPPVEIISAVDLLARHFEPARWAVPELLPSGVTILAGRPKLGKSWLALGLALAIAAGGRALGQIPVEPGEVLYLALEDGPRRLQERLQALLDSRPPPARLHFATRWPRLDAGGLEALDTWLAGHPDARLIVVDTLKRVRPREPATARLYDADYDAVAGLQELAQRHRVCILLIHHTRKAEADDPLDLISGTTGLTAGADGALVLRRTRGASDAELVGCHRDLPADLSLALRWDHAITNWILVGDAEE